MAGKLIEEGKSKFGRRVWVERYSKHGGYYHIGYHLGKKVGHNAYLPIETSLKPKDYWLKKAEKIFKSFLRDVNPLSDLRYERDLAGTGRI